MTTALRDLFDLPDQIRKGDFVLKLSEGVLHPEETAATYVVTPPLVDAFGRALMLVKGALRDQRSQAAYIHGSFGSGKSHFMALLSLLLGGNEAAWRVPELHALRASHPWIADKKILQLRFHMVGQRNLESAVFGEYIRFVREMFPKAPVPPLFADEQLFADAAQHLASLGDEKFFAPMNPASGAEEGWGEIATAARWDSNRFAQAVASTSPDEREALFDALVRTHFKAFAQQNQSFVDFDRGLAILARHAKTLKFNAVVFFLDELVLWLASRASDQVFLHQEMQKAVKLVEAQDASRELPIVSFIARQRDLAEMVGEQFAGSDEANLRSSLRHWEGRFDTIKLEDRNLPAIVERRVLKARSPEARRKLDEAFVMLKKQAGASWSTLLGLQDGEAFGKLYPFSPALVETLVALSNSLQRERTAIKILMEILVEHIPDLHMGQVVPVGDLFDVLAGGEDSADGVMKARFESAKQVYKYQLLPLIQEGNGTGSEARCQRLRPSHPTRLGCSACPERTCRNDNRIVKSLLIAALVPEVNALRDMTASRLVQLNYGTLRDPIPGREANTVAQKLREWAAAVGQLHVGAQTDPTVILQLEGVDVAPILNQARSEDNTGARQAILRDLLFEKLGVAKSAGTEIEHAVDWRSTKRHGHIRFGNVHRIVEALRCPEDFDWRLVIDYPFDEPGFGPADDLRVIEQVIEEGTGTWTLVWLPSFFSESTNRLLGELCILQAILETPQSMRKAIQHLSVEQQSRAEVDLDNLRNQKKARLGKILEQAYGLASPVESDLDSSRSLSDHLYVLKPGAHVNRSLATVFPQAVDGYVSALLEARYPRHPAFTRKLAKNAKLVERLLETFGRLVDADDKKLAADRDAIDEAKGSLGQLGLVRWTEAALHLREDGTVQELEKKRQQSSVEAPTAGEVRRWIDEGGKMGLEAAASDLVIRAYARATARTLVRLGKGYAAHAGTEIPEDVVLDRPALPAAADWNAALSLAGSAAGVVLVGRALHADNLRKFEDLLHPRLLQVTAHAARLPSLLRKRLDELGLPANVDRLVTAVSADALCATLHGKGVIEQVRALATFEPKMSALAVGTSLNSAKTVVDTLDDELVFGVFTQLHGQQATLNGAMELLEDVAKVLRQDELNVALADRLRALATAGQTLLRPKAPPTLGGTAPAAPLSSPSPGAKILFQQDIKARGRGEALARLRALVQEVENALETSDADVLLAMTLTLTTDPIR